DTRPRLLDPRRPRPAAAAQRLRAARRRPSVRARAGDPRASQREQRHPAAARGAARREPAGRSPRRLRASGRPVRPRDARDLRRGRSPGAPLLERRPTAPARRAAADRRGVAAARRGPAAARRPQPVRLGPALPAAARRAVRIQHRRELRPTAVPSLDTIAQDAGDGALAGLETVVESADRQPTQQSRDVFDGARARLARAQGRWQEFVTKDLPALNAQRARQHLSPVTALALTPDAIAIP